MYTNKQYNAFPKSFNGFMEEVLHTGKVLSDTVLKDNRPEVPVNIVETDTAYLLDVAAPGLSKTAFQIKVEKNVLTLSYEHATEAAAEGKVLRSEFAPKSFSRSFTLNEKVNPDAISAKYTDGVLKVTIQKKEQAVPVSRNISVE